MHAPFDSSNVSQRKGQVKHVDASIKPIPSVTDVNIIRVPLLKKSYLVRFFLMPNTDTSISSKS